MVTWSGDCCLSHMSQATYRFGLTRYDRVVLVSSTKNTLMGVHFKISTDVLSGRDLDLQSLDSGIVCCLIALSEAQ